MRTLLAVGLVLMCSLVSSSQEPHPKTVYHGCREVSSSANHPHLFDAAEYYQCDEGEIEISGTWNESIQGGYVYDTTLGRVDGDPRPVSDSDFEYSKWCPKVTRSGIHIEERCGSKPGPCWDGKSGTWDPAWQGYSCMTPDHMGK